MAVTDLAGVCTGPGPCDTTPFGKGANWVTKVGGLPVYMRAVAKAFRRKGLPESEAIQRAIGVVKNWAEGKGNVTAATRARAVAAVAEWERKKAQAHALTASPTATVDLAFTENLHPRAPKGVSNGGKFVAKNGGGSGGEKSVGATYRSQVRDFQKRTGLKVTGKLDTATRAKMAKLRKPSSGGGSGKTKKAAAASRHIATASAVNGLTDAQREQFRILRPAPPPGYHWDHNNRLVRATPQSRRIHRILGVGK